MKKHGDHCSFIREAVFFLVISLLVYPSCATTAYQTHKTWIDQPFGSASFPAGQPFVLFGHTFAEDGVAEIVTYIAGEPYNRFLPDNPGSDFSAFSDEVLIAEPGTYMLSVVSVDLQGNLAPAVFKEITITAGDQFIQLQDTAESWDSPMPTVEIQETESYAPIEISFWADSEQLQQGGCTTLHWEIFHADTVTLQGNVVAMSDSMQICPSTTSNYTLIASSALDRVEKHLDVDVLPPTPEDTQPPEINNISHTQQEIWNYQTCGPVEFDVRAQVNDPSGIDEVTIKFRVVKDGNPGVWVTASMNKSGDWYQTTISAAQLKASMDGYRGTVEYYLRALDRVENLAESTLRSLPVKDCLL